MDNLIVYLAAKANTVARIIALCLIVSPAQSKDLDSRNTPLPPGPPRLFQSPVDVTGGIPPSIERLNAPTPKKARPTKIAARPDSLCTPTGTSLGETLRMLATCLTPPSLLMDPTPMNPAPTALVPMLDVPTSPTPMTLAPVTTTGEAGFSPEDNLITGTLAQNVANASSFSLFLRRVTVWSVICQTLHRLYEAPLVRANGCEGRITNRAESISYVITPIDPVAQTYEVELLGKSSALALKSPYWVERHRFFISIGFGASLEPQITVIDFEPMIRTTAEIFPERSDLFEHIGIEHDSEIRVLQERIRSSIASSLQQAVQLFAEAQQ